MNVVNPVGDLIQHSHQSLVSGIGLYDAAKGMIIRPRFRLQTGALTRRSSHRDHRELMVGNSIANENRAMRLYFALTAAEKSREGEWGNG
jgi:hypothetical protein